METNDTRTATQQHQDLSDNWKTCAADERIKTEKNILQNLKDLDTPEAIMLGYDFAAALQERNNSMTLEIIEKIEKLPMNWRNES
jgi:hypothetical protein